MGGREACGLEVGSGEVSGVESVEERPVVYRSAVEMLVV